MKYKECPICLVLKSPPPAEGATFSNGVISGWFAATLMEEMNVREDLSDAISLCLQHEAVIAGLRAVSLVMLERSIKEREPSGA